MHKYTCFDHLNSMMFPTCQYKNGRYGRIHKPQCGYFNRPISRNASKKSLYWFYPVNHSLVYSTKNWFLYTVSVLAQNKLNLILSIVHDDILIFNFLCINNKKLRRQ